jgi:DNA-binding NtrC family response regulator
MQSPPSARLRLMLLENDPMVRETLTCMLQDHYEIAQAISVKAALEQLAVPDLPAIAMIVLDCPLPPGQVAEVLAAADGRQIPVLMISGDLTQAHPVNADRPFLAKPFTQSALLSAMDTARG